MKKGKPLNLDAYEQEIEDGFGRDGFELSTGIFEPRKRELAAYALGALKKERRINLRLRESDYQAIQLKAVDENIPYQTLIASLVHKYVTGRLAESKAGH